MIATMLTAALALTGLSQAQTQDPRLQIDNVSTCVETAKQFLRSNQYSDEQQRQDLIGACRDADPLCVREVGENLSSSERGEAQTFLPLIRACRGQGKGGCYRALIASLPSYDRNEASEAQALLKKCE